MSEARAPAVRTTPTERAVARAADAVEACVRDLSPETFEGPAAVRLLEAFTRLGKLAMAGQALMARRVDACGAHRASGHASSAHLLAATAGVSVGRASETIETGKRLAEQPAVDAAFRAGRLSGEQAGVITDAVAADPRAEQALLDTADRETLRTLRGKAAAVRAAADDDRYGTYVRQRNAQCLRLRNDRDGMVRGELALPPDTGTALATRIEAEVDRVYRAARRYGAPARSHAWYAAEALTRLVCGGTVDPESGTPAKVRVPEVVVHVSLESLRRGHTEAAEVCEVLGGGPVPVEVPKAMLANDAFLTGVVVDGTDVMKVRRFGRHISADLRTALEVRGYLGHRRVVCSVPECGRELGIEWDHDVERARGGPGSYDNYRPLCRTHHMQKTAAFVRARTRGGHDPP